MVEVRHDVVVVEVAAGVGGGGGFGVIAGIVADVDVAGADVATAVGLCSVAGDYCLFR